MNTKQLSRVMKKNILFISVLFLFIRPVFSQVGIGSSTPSANSILDLTNSADKFLQLPIATVTPTAASLDTIGAMIYYNGHIYLKTSAGIKVFTPWKGDGSAEIYSPLGNPVGIGTIPTSNSNQLTIAAAASTGVSISQSTIASVAIGNTGSQLLMDEDEIMVKSSATAAATMQFQKEGGVVAIGNFAPPTNATVLQTNGSIDARNTSKIKENGADLVPSGTIAMWNSTTIPAGWALCNGSLGTPDLRDKFIVGAGDNITVDGSSYPLAATGGNVSSEHTHDIQPNPTSTNSNTGHTHSGTTDSNGARDICNCSCIDGSYAKGNHNHPFTTSSEDTHTHSYSLPPVPSLGQMNLFGFLSSENRPPFYALIFIMKL